MPEIKEQLKLKGRITILRHPAGMVERFLKLIKAGKIKEFLDLQQRYSEIGAENHNTIMTGSGTGTDIIGQWLGSSYVLAQGGSVVPVGLTFGAIGTSSTTPTTADTQLTAEYARSAVSFYQNTGFTLANLQCFLSDAQVANGTYPEAGFFAGGSAAANSGNIFNHALFGSPFVKTSGVDTTIQLSVTL